ERPEVVPLDAGVEDGDHHVWPPGLAPPGDLAAHAAHAEELVRAAEHGRVRGAEARARELPLVPVPAAARPAHLVPDRSAGYRRALRPVRRDAAAGGLRRWLSMRRPCLSPDGRFSTERFGL